MVNICKLTIYYIDSEISKENKQYWIEKVKMENYEIIKKHFILWKYTISKIKKDR